MAAAVTDKFIKGPANKSSTLSSSISDSVQTIPISDLTGVPTDTAVYAAIDAHDSSGTATPSTKEIVKGVVSGSNLINCTRGAEGTAQSHSAGAVVEFFFTAAANNDIVDGIVEEHNQDGTHSDITATSVTTTGDVTVGDDIVVADGKSINDGNDNELVVFQQTASAVNEVEVTNAATGNAPQIAATGGDTNIDLNLVSKGDGHVQINGNDVQAGAWADWTPTWTNLTVASSTVTAKYIQIGKTVHYRLHVNLAGGNKPSGAVTFSLPVTSVSYPETATTQVVGNAVYLDTGTTTIVGVALWASTTTAQLRVIGAASTYGNLSDISATIPFTWANDDEIHVTGTYEAA